MKFTLHQSCGKFFFSLTCKHVPDFPLSYSLPCSESCCIEKYLPSPQVLVLLEQELLGCKTVTGGFSQKLGAIRNVGLGDDPAPGTEKEEPMTHTRDSSYRNELWKITQEELGIGRLRVTGTGQNKLEFKFNIVQPVEMTRICAVLWDPAGQSSKRRKLPECICQSRNDCEPPERCHQCTVKRLLWKCQEARGSVNSKEVLLGIL